MQISMHTLHVCCDTEQVPATMPIRSGENFTDKIWKNPQEAVVHLYQTECSPRTTSIYLSIYLLVYASIYSSMHLSVYLSTHPSICLYMYTAARIFYTPFLHTNVAHIYTVWGRYWGIWMFQLESVNREGEQVCHCLSVSLSLCLSVSLSLCLSVSLSPCLSVSLSLCLSVSLSLCLSVSLSPCLPVSLCLNREGEQASMTFSRGGWQEARGGGIGGKGGRGHPQDYFVENVFEELDDEREYYFNRTTSTLFWRPPNGTSPTALREGELVAPAVETLLKVSADYVRFEGLQFAHTLPTYMQPYEPTSGGDWAVHRGAATMIENASGVVFESCVWRHIEANGVMLSHRVRDSKLANSEIDGAGDTPVVLLGSADLMDGRSGTQPWHNEISGNYLHHFGPSHCTFASPSHFFIQI
eukprot:COSAG03_NODE_380_length_8364_cov_20.212099_9_plen_413_part_00